MTIAKQVEADLIVVGNRGMKGVKRLVLGSVPNDVATALCAVLILMTDRRPASGSGWSARRHAEPHGAG